MRFMKGRMPSPSMAVATGAMVVALGGTSYAAVKLTPNSVTSAAIKTGAVSSSDVRSSAISSRHIKDRTLLAKDFKAGQLPAGATGAPGAPGAPGAAGAPGAPGAPGAQGERGPSNAFAGSDVNEAISEAVPGSEEVLRLTLPAGSFTLVAKLTLEDNSGGNAGDPVCSVSDLIGPDELAEDLDQTQVNVPAGLGPRVLVALAGTVSHDSPRPVAVRCVTEAASAQNALRARDIKLVATQVASIG